MTTEDLINELAKPIMVWRFARGQCNEYVRHINAPHVVRGAEKRMAKAESEIEAIVTRWTETRVR